MRIHRAALWLVVSVVSVLLTLLLFGNDLRHIQTIIPSLGLLAPAVSIVLYGVLSLTPIPAEPLSLLNGALFGPVVGILVNWMGNNFAAGVEYYIGRDIASPKKKMTKKKQYELPGFFKYIPVDSVWFLLLGRMVPGYGSKVVSFAGGIYNVPLRRYIWTTAVMNLLGSILLALSGHFLIQL